MSKKINFKISSNTVVHAKTEEEANKLCELLDKLGARWCSDNRYTEIDYWCTYGVNTCYDVHGGCFGGLHFFIEEGFNIISVKEFIKLHEIEDKKNEIDFKIDNKTVIHTTTINEANKLCEFLDKLGARWIDGKRYTEDNYWDEYTDDNCYDPHIGEVGRLEYYEKENYTIITVDEFLKLHEPETISECLDTIIDSLDYAERQLIRLLKKHNDCLAKGENTDTKIQHIIDTVESLKLLKAASCKLHSVKNK